MNGSASAAAPHIAGEIAVLHASDELLGGNVPGGHAISLHHFAQIKIGPPLALLVHGMTSKVFQNLTAPQVIEKVIKDELKQFLF